MGKAISNPLLDEMSLASAKGLVINITGGTDLTLFEVDEAANRIRREVDENANIIVGSAFHEELDGMMRVSIVATGVTYLRKGVERPEPLVREIREADAGDMDVSDAQAPGSKSRHPKSAPTPVPPFATNALEGEMPERLLRLYGGWKKIRILAGGPAQWY